MARIYIGLGSNQDAERNLRAAVAGLGALLGPLRLSSVYRSAAVGFDGPPFLNLVAEAQTNLSIEALAAALRAIETALGRVRGIDAAHSSHSADLDLLLYDDCVCSSPLPLPRPEITANAFVLWPLAELAGERIHPLTGLSYHQLWQQYDKRQQQLEPLAFDWSSPYLSTHH